MLLLSASSHRTQRTRYLSSILVRAALEVNPGNPWAGFKVYLDSVATYCNNATNQKWLGRLSGVDVFGLENSYAMVAALSETNLGRSNLSQ